MFSGFHTHTSFYSNENKKAKVSRCLLAKHRSVTWTLRVALAGWRVCFSTWTHPAWGMVQRFLCHCYGSHAHWLFPRGAAPVLPKSALTHLCLEIPSVVSTILLFLLRRGFTWNCSFQCAPVFGVKFGIFLLASQKYSKDCHITPSCAHPDFTFSFKVTSSELTRSQIHRVVELWGGLSWEGPPRSSSSKFPAMGRNTLHWTRLFQTWLWGFPGMGRPQGNLCQGFTVLIAKNLLLTFCLRNLHLV